MPSTEMRTRAGYLAYGPWPLILDLYLISVCLLCCYLSYTLSRGYLDGTPAAGLGSIDIYGATIASFCHLACYPFSHLRSKLYGYAWPQGRRYYFTLGFLTALGHAITCMTGFLYLHRMPTSMDTTDPCYTVQRAGDYRAWVNGRLSLAFLAAVCAVLAMVDCAIFVRWDFEREMRDRRRDPDLQLRRWRVMFEERGSEHEGATGAGVVHERPGGKEDDV